MTTRTSDIILACFFPKHGDVQLNMIGRENGEQPTPNRFRRGRISLECREQIKTAYASGIGLREIARNMGIPEGTVLARAQREGWTREIQNAKALAKREHSAPAVTATEAAAISMQQRGERHGLAAPDTLASRIRQKANSCVAWQRTVLPFRLR
jgi:hypothetical protein